MSQTIGTVLTIMLTVAGVDQLIFASASAIQYLRGLAPYQYERYPLAMLLLAAAYLVYDSNNRP